MDDAEMLRRIYAVADYVTIGRVVNMGTHSEHCFRWHVECLASRVLELIPDEYKG